MAKHETHKATQRGKAQTLARKAARRAKQGMALDLDRLARDLGAVVA